MREAGRIYSERAENASLPNLLAILTNFGTLGQLCDDIERLLKVQRASCRTSPIRLEARKAFKAGESACLTKIQDFLSRETGSLVSRAISLDRMSSAVPNGPSRYIQDIQGFLSETKNQLESRVPEDSLVIVYFSVAQHLSTSLLVRCTI